MGCVVYVIMGVASFGRADGRVRAPGAPGVHIGASDGAGGAANDGVAAA